MRGIQGGTPRRRVDLPRPEESISSQPSPMERERRGKSWGSSSPKTRVILALILVWFYWKAVWHIARPIETQIGLKRRECSYWSKDSITSRKRKEKQALQIAVATFDDGMEMALKNKQKYATLRGYKLLVRPGKDLSRKFSFLRENLESFDYIFWLDPTSVIANFSIKVEDIVDDEKHDLFFSTDGLDLISDAFILHRSPWSFSYLESLSEQSWLVSDRKAMLYLHGSRQVQADIKKHKKKPYPETQAVRKHSRAVPRCVLNSVVCEDFTFALLLWRRGVIPGMYCDNQFQSGDFVVHLRDKSPWFYRNWLIELFEHKAMHENRKFFYADDASNDELM